MKGRLVIISAPSGAGKTTIVNHLLGKGLNLEFSISATTRTPRGSEKNGKDYYFISPDEFRHKIANNDFVEWEEVYRDHYYGTLKSEIERIWANGCHVLFDVDVMGGIALKNIFRDEAIAIFIMPPSVDELEKRLRLRATDDPTKIRVRVDKAIDEMNFAGKFDYIVVNDNLEQAKDETYRFVSGFIDASCRE